MAPKGQADVLVAGRGPAGLAAAIALAERGMDTLTIAPAMSLEVLTRAEMLPRAAQEVLQRLGAACILTGSLALSGVERNWSGARNDHLEGLEIGLEGPGWSVDRAALQLTLESRAKVLGVTAIEGRVCSIAGQPGCWRVGLAGGGHIAARYMIDATGRPAALARRLGAKARFGLPLVARVWTEPRMRSVLLKVEARPDGWCYALPHPAGGMSVGSLTRPDAGNTAHQGAPDCRAVDARSMALTPMAGRGWLAAGDAAAAFDPIASQGLFNALSGGFFAGNAAADTVLGAPENAQVYQLLADRTARRTHTQIAYQYAASRHRTTFWAERARPAI